MLKQTSFLVLALAAAAPSWAACDWVPGETTPLSIVRCLTEHVNTIDAWLSCDGDVGPSDHCYTLLPDPLPFGTAQAACRDWGGHLATVDSTGENDFIFGVAAGSDAWIGHQDVQFEGNWTTTTGEVAVLDENTVFQAWGDGEPNDAGGEDCAQLRSDGLWNDAPCDASFRPMCERDF